MKKIKVGILGYGLSGSVFHMPNLWGMEGFSVEKISTSNHQKAKDIEEKYPGVLVVQNPEEILRDEEIQLVIVATPNEYHFEFARAALDQGKYVILEKPITITTEEARSLQALAKEKGVAFIPYHNRRFDGDFLTVKDLLATGKLGKLAAYESHFDRFRPKVKENSWREEKRPGGGIVYDLGPHLIDQAIHLFGRPKDLWAQVATKRPGALMDDDMMIIMNYEDHQVTLVASALAPVPRPRFLLQGDQAGFITYGLDPQEDDLRAGLLPDTHEPWGQGQPGKLYPADEDYRLLPGRYRSFYEGVYQFILEGKESPVSMDDGVLVMELIEAVFKSSRDKVRISL